MKIAAFLLTAGLLASLGLLAHPLNQTAYAHTFSMSESVQFLSLVERIRAETSLVVANLENNNATLAQEHASKAAGLLDNTTLDEIRERNERIANTLSTSLAQLEGNMTSLAAQGQVPQDRTQQTNQTVSMLNDILAEAIAVRVESDQMTNATTWALVIADLTNAVLSEYGNATGAPFDLTDMSNLSGNQSSANNMTTMDQGMSMPNDTAMSMSNASSANATTSATIVDMAAYQSALYLANSTIMVFDDNLRPLTTAAATDTNA
ncbi:MAG TPA: hypothetical protein VF172_08695, partial [Nitrososphaera sp.]